MEKTEFTEEIIDRCEDKGIEVEILEEVAEAFGYDLEETLDKIDYGEIACIGNNKDYESEDEAVGKWYVEMCGGIRYIDPDDVENYFDFDGYGGSLYMTTDTDSNGDIWVEY